MELSELLNVTYIGVGIAFLGVVGYLFFTKQAVKSVVLKLLPFLPGLLRYLSNKVPDEKGVFDRHDLLQTAARVSEKILQALRDAGNHNLDDLKDDIRDAVISELKTYRDAGVKNVPDLASREVERLVDVLFSNIQVVLETTQARESEDQSGNDQ